MNKTFTSIIFFFLLGSTIFLIGRSFRGSKMPHGSKFSCNTCHTNGGGSPRNAFGLDVEARVTPNGTESFWNAELAALDSDGDGFTNGEELQDPNGEWREGSANPGDASLVTNPGNANSVPTSLFDISNNFVFHLSNNYPNPFNPSTTISFSIPQQSSVKLVVHNSLGEEVAQLLNGSISAGIHNVNFDATNLSSGLYFYKITADSFVEVKKMLLIK